MSRSIVVVDEELVESPLPPSPEKRRRILQNQFIIRESGRIPSLCHILSKIPHRTHLSYSPGTLIENIHYVRRRLRLRNAL